MASSASALPAERNVFAKGDIVVTTRQIKFGTKTVALMNLASVAIQKRENYRNDALPRILAGLMLIGIGWFVLRVASHGFGGVVIALGGYLFVYGCGRYLNHERWQEVTLRTSGGIETLRVQNIQDAIEIKDGIERAIAIGPRN